jgi:peptide/nickel transport system ATP-binding protein
VSDATPLLDVKGLRTEFRSGGSSFAAVDGISFSLAPGETLGIVGESGCGKSVTSLSIMRLVPNPPGRITAGEIRLEGRNLLDLPESDMRAVRGDDIAMIFQEPMTSLNPVQTVGEQIVEAVQLHRPLGAAEARARALEMLRLVKIPSPETRLDEYPHQLSGGMRQRVMIAMALACDPKLLIADEPTTALDVTIQAQILDLLRDLRERTGAAIMLITHDLGVVAELAHRVIVMYCRPHRRGSAGRPPVRRSAASLYARPPGLDPAAGQRWRRTPHRHRRRRAQSLRAAGRLPLQPALSARRREMPGRAADLARNRARPPRRLLEGTARPGSRRGRRMTTEPLLSVTGLAKHFPVKRGIVFQSAVGTVRAVDGLTFDVAPGETLALVGESGCGKSTTGRLILRLIEATEGTIRFAGRDVRGLSRGALRDLRRNMQIIFQDPYASLNPRLTVGETLAEPLRLHGLASGAALRKRIDELLGEVGLSAWHALRYPHEFSGGQRQRIGIARALGLKPKLIVCDEPVSALDVSVQAQVLNLLQELQQQAGSPTLHRPRPQRRAAHE